jgi:response regulator RpfG family c-di-GMP phosphodiesterase
MGIDFSVGCSNILIAEDSPTQAERLKYLLEKRGCKAQIAENGEEALRIIESDAPDIVISDVVMPGMNGFELCRRVKSDPKLAEIPVVLLTSLSDPTDIVKGLECGANNFITKPYDEAYLFSCLQFILMNRSIKARDSVRFGIEIYFAGQKHIITAERQQILGLLLSTFETAVQKNNELIKAKQQLQELNESLEEKVRERTESLTLEIAERRRLEARLQQSNIDLRNAYETTIEGWSRALDLRDRETEGHTRRVAELTVKLATMASYPDEQIIHLKRGALLHDIGKMGIPDEILHKPGPLSDEEWVIMKKHPVYAYELLYPIEYLRNSLEIPYCHHEKWDGTGYPRGLKGNEIPEAARLFAVADIWDALQSNRPYRAAWEPERILNHIRGLSGSHLDPKAVDIFESISLEIAVRK